MSTGSYSLPGVTAAVVERLEGARRTWLTEPVDARAGLTRIAAEHVERVIAEHDELLGDDGTGAVLRREVIDTMLPRYLRLAVDHNELEHIGYKSWRKGDPAARIAATLFALLLAYGVTRLVHSPVALLSFGVALLVPFVPELRANWYRRRYQAELQSLVDDMVRIQVELDRFPAAIAAEPSASRVTRPKEVEGNGRV
jgi:hypothetical protein